MLLAGEVGKPHGLAGDVYVVVISDDPHRYEPGATLFRGDGRTLEVASARVHGERFLVRFVGVESREDALLLRGPLYVPATERRSLDPDEFWHDDLVGCSVVNADGDNIGTVGGVIAGAAQDLLQITTPNGEQLIPIVKEIVLQVDIATKTVVVDPPEGLLD